MRRGTDKEETLELLKHMREKIPNVAIRTTLIVGYPGEGDKEFEELKDFVREQRFARLGVFAYSAEEGTAANELGDPIDEDEKQRRVDEIMEIQEHISLEKNEARIGTIVSVLIDRTEGEYYIGRTEQDSPEVDDEVLVVSNKKLKVGEFYNVKITKAYEHDLYGIC